MVARKLVYVRIVGSAINEDYVVAAHEIVGFSADTFHKLTKADGTIIYVSTFGVRSVTVADSLEKLNGR